MDACHCEMPHPAATFSLTSTEISERLRRNTATTIPESRPPLSPGSSSSVPAAVLIPMVSIDQAWHLLFIRRADNDQDHHSGQVAFPGGRHEADDLSMESTALREAWEEVGLRSADVRILGHLNDHVSTTCYRIRPVVGHAPWPYPLRIDKKEVSRYFTIPFDWLANQGNREIRHWRLSEQQSPIPVIYYREYEGEVLWGATARITVGLIDTLTKSQG